MRRKTFSTHLVSRLPKAPTPLAPKVPGTSGVFTTISAVAEFLTAPVTPTELIWNDLLRGGLFIHDAAGVAADADGGTTFASATGALWRRVFSGAFDVRWFGAVGDFDFDTLTGTDDTLAIQAALDALGPRDILGVPAPSGDTGYYYTDHLYVTREQSIWGWGSPRFYTNGKSMIVGSSQEVSTVFEHAGSLRDFQIRSTETFGANGRVGSNSRGIIYGGGDSRNPSLSCTTTSASRTLTTAGSFHTGDGAAAVLAGSKAVGTGIPVDTFVISVDSATSLTLSKPATASGTVSVQFLQLETRTHEMEHVYVRGFDKNIYSSATFGFSWYDVRSSLGDTGILFEFDDDAWVSGSKNAGTAMSIVGGIIGANRKAGLHIKGTTIDGVGLGLFGTDVEQNGMQQSDLNANPSYLFGDGDIYIEDCENIVSLHSINTEGAGKANPKIVLEGGSLNVFGGRISGCTTNEVVTAGSTVTVGTGKTLTVSAITNAMPIGSELVFSGGGTLKLTTKADAGDTSLTGDVTDAGIATSETADYGILATIEVRDNAKRQNNLFVAGPRIIYAHTRNGIYGYSGGTMPCNIHIHEFIPSGAGSGTAFNGKADQLIQTGTGQQILNYPGTSEQIVSMLLGHSLNIETRDGVAPGLRINGEIIARALSSAKELDTYAGGGFQGGVAGFNSGESPKFNEPRYKIDGTGLYFGAGQRSSGTTDGTTASKLEDSTADFVTDGVEVGDTVWNTTDETSTTVTAVDDLNTLSLAADIFVSGENYTVGQPPSLIVQPASVLPGNWTVELDGSDLVYKLSGIEKHRIEA